MMQNQAEYRPNQCFYYGLQNCHKDQCSEFSYDHEAGQCHINPQTGCVHVRPAEGGGRSIHYMPNKPNIQSVQRAYNKWRKDNRPLGGGQTPVQNNFISTNVSSICVGSASHKNEGLYNTDEDKGEQAEVNTLNISNSAGKKREANGTPLPSVHTHQAGFYDNHPLSEPVRDGDVDMSNNTAPLPSADTSQKDWPKPAPSGDRAPKSILKKPTTNSSPAPTVLPVSTPAPQSKCSPAPKKLANKLKQSNNAGDLLKRILNQPLKGVTVHNLLESSQSLHQAFFQQLPSVPDGMVSRPPTPPPTIRKVSAQKVVEDTQRSKLVRTEQVIYAMDVLQTNITINRHVISTLINMGSMINIMRMDLAESLGLNLKYGPNLTMVVQSGESVMCTACAEDILISIGDITTHMLGNVRNTGHVTVSQHPLARDLSRHSSDPGLA